VPGFYIFEQKEKKRYTDEPIEIILDGGMADFVDKISPVIGKRTEKNIPVFHVCKLMKRPA